MYLGFRKGKKHSFKPKYDFIKYGNTLYFINTSTYFQNTTVQRANTLIFDLRQTIVSENRLNVGFKTAHINLLSDR